MRTARYPPARLVKQSLEPHCWERSEFRPFAGRRSNNRAEIVIAEIGFVCAGAAIQSNAIYKCLATDPFGSVAQSQQAWFDYADAFNSLTGLLAPLASFQIYGYAIL